MAVTLVPVPTDQIGAFWGQLGPFVAKAASRYRKEYELEDVLDALMGERAMLIGISVDGAFQGAMTVAPVEQPKRRTLEVELVGGIDARMWYSDTVKQLANMARSAGYDAIASSARRGWMKMATDSGFKAASVNYEMEL